MFAVVLDSCVLVPSLKRDVILSFAGEGLLKPLWSDRILAEVERTIRRLREKRGDPPNVVAEYLTRLFSEMARVFPDACATGWEALEGTFGLPDPDDEHVVALAVKAGAGAIVTDNLKDYPSALLPGELHALSPREFAERTVDVNPQRAVVALTALAERRGLDPLNLCNLILLQCDMREAVDGLKAVLLASEDRESARNAPHDR